MNWPLIAASFLPGLLILWWILRHDRYRSEPPMQLVICFLAGALITLPIYWVEKIANEAGFGDDSDVGLTLIYAFAVVALSEELAKFLVLRLYIFRHPDFDEPLDGIVYAAMIGIGFACVENAVYALRFDDWDTIIVRSFTAVPAHASFAIISGYYVGKAKFDLQNRKKLLQNALLWPVIAHGIYDFCIMQSLYDWMLALALPVLIICIYFAWQLIEEYDEKTV